MFTTPLVNTVKGCWSDSQDGGPFWDGWWQCHSTCRPHPTTIIGEMGQVCLCWHLSPCQSWWTTHHHTSWIWFRSLVSIERRILKGCYIKPSQSAQQLLQCQSWPIKTTYQVYQYYPNHLASTHCYKTPTSQYWNHWHDPSLPPQILCSHTISAHHMERRSKAKWNYSFS